MSSITRRRFIASSTALGAATLLSRRVFGASTRPDQLRVGLIGCGGRGYGAIADALVADPNVRVTALADLFPDRLPLMEKEVSKILADRANRPDVVIAAGAIDRTLGERAKVPPERRFAGWDAYEKLCALEDVDVVLMAPPPVFRPLHLEAALRHGKHVFMEKPVCVDAVGARKMFELARVADEKRLSVVAGTQRRHQGDYIEGMKRLHDGQIGEIVAAHCYWLEDAYIGSRLQVKELAPEEMEYQVRNWLVFGWACGDHIVEQHVHNLDVVLWALGRLPVQCVAQGGRGVDLPMPAYGNRFSHFASEFEFANQVRVASYCRQEPGTFRRVSETIVGTKGVLNFIGRNTHITGEKPWKFEGNVVDPYVQEHIDLYASIRAGKPLNEIPAVTTSTVMAILGRESAYTGRAIKYDWLLERSQQNLTPSEWSFGSRPISPLPVPGKTELV